MTRSVWCLTKINGICTRWIVPYKVYGVISLEVGQFDHTKKINQSWGYNPFAIAAIVSWRGVTAVLVHHFRRQVKIDTPNQNHFFLIKGEGLT